MFHTHVSRTEKQAQSRPCSRRALPVQVCSPHWGSGANTPKVGGRPPNPSGLRPQGIRTKAGRYSEKVIVHDFTPRPPSPPAASQSPPYVQRSAQDPLCDGKAISETLEEFQDGLEKAWLELHPDCEMNPNIMGDMIRRWVFLTAGMDSKGRAAA